MKTVRRLENVMMLRKGGSFVFCEQCEKIVGSINIQGYKYIKLAFTCTCDRNIRHILEFARDNKTNPDEYVGRMPNVNNNICHCRECGMPLLSMMEDRVVNYSFYVKCVCGQIYDTRTQYNKRLDETVGILKDRYKKK